jgi:2-polyprenyl-6-methoxyphenol hydroxylase-like FAD-dependent oxidoreductase
VPKPITIIGGGLAGLTLGIGLRQSGIPVTVWESSHYPRHRVCGEFVSGRGQQVLARLGLQKQFECAGAVRSHTVAFFANENSSPARKLSEPALCLSRYEMDALLANEFQRLGGDLRSKSRWQEKNFEAEGIVRATGRRSQPTENGWRWFGLKVHARKLPLTADLEMHALPHGYLGLGITSGGAVNVCGLFRGRAGDGSAGAIGIQTLRGPIGTALHERLAKAEFDEESFCSVAGLTLRPRRASGRNECCIGDAVTMIPPVTGNGMSMAFESAEIATEPLANYSGGKISWIEVQKKIAADCDVAFSQRLAWARFLQWMMFNVASKPVLGSMTLRSDWLWQMMFSKTR